MTLCKFVCEYHCFRRAYYLQHQTELKENPSIAEDR